jgi:hypothetical protein
MIKYQKKLMIFLYTIIIISILYLYFAYRYYVRIEGFESPNPQNERNGIIFTCTTFFDYRTKDRWDRFCRAIDTIKEYHSPNTLSKIKKWIVVNEYSDKPSEDWAKKMKDRYPMIEFYQKNENEKGQARSMNIILKKIRDADLWLQWEESWEVRKTFLDDSIEFMNTNKDITQIQKLELNNNEIESIDNHDFRGMFNIETLDLSSNQIAKFDALVFNDLTNLNQLDLSFNNITN